MPAPTADIDICNLALDHIGQGAITSIEPPSTKEEAIMARWYDIVRRVCLREYVWNFARRRTVLAADTEVPAFDYTTQFLLPVDCLRVLSLGGVQGSYPISDFDINGRYIFTNNQLNSSSATGALNLRYISDVTDVTQMDSLFINIFAMRLALRVAYKFSIKPGLVTQVNSMLGIEEGKAVTVDSQEVPTVRVQRSRYLSARTAGYSSGYALPYTIFY
jgi:hypothetical protein